VECSSKANPSQRSCYSVTALLTQLLTGPSFSLRLQPFSQALSSQTPPTGPGLAHFGTCLSENNKDRTPVHQKHRTPCSFLVAVSEPPCNSSLQLAKEKAGKGVKKGALLSHEVVSLGGAWLKPAVQQGLLTPLPSAQQSEWWERLGPKWRRFVTRNTEGD
jgi:hypothetical protein